MLDPNALDLTDHVTWIWHPRNLGLACLPDSSYIGLMNLKIIKQYQNVLHDYKKITQKTVWKNKNTSICKAYFCLFQC